MTKTLKTMTSGAGYHECSTCSARIANGQHYYRAGSRYTHAVAGECVVAAPAVMAPAPAPERDARFDSYVAERLGLNVRDSSDTFLANLPPLADAE